MPDAPHAIPIIPDETPAAPASLAITPAATPAAPASLAITPAATPAAPGGITLAASLVPMWLYTVTYQEGQVVADDLDFVPYIALATNTDDNPRGLSANWQVVESFSENTYGWSYVTGELEVVLIGTVLWQALEQTDYPPDQRPDQWRIYPNVSVAAVPLA